MRGRRRSRTRQARRAAEEILRTRRALCQMARGDRHRCGHPDHDRDPRQCPCAGALCRTLPGRADRSDRRARSADGWRSRHRPLLRGDPARPQQDVSGIAGAARRAGRHDPETEHGDFRQEKSKTGLGRRSRREDHSAVEVLRPRGGARHCLSLRRAIRRGRHRASGRDERTRPPALASHLLLRRGCASRAAKGVVGQGREPRRRPARIHPPRADEFARQQGRMEGRSGKEGGIDLAPKSVPPRPVPRLYLATPDVDDPAQLVAALPGLLAAADVAAVLVRLKPTDQRTMISRVKALAPAIQASGAAVLLEGHVELVARTGADAAPLTGTAAMEDALPSLKPDRIAGVGGLTTRHDSMAAGELGADYVLFGEPDASGQRPATEAIAERLQWWDELFEPPCVGFAVSREEAAEFAGAGADFVLVGDFVWADPRGANAALIHAGEAIAQAYEAAFGKTKTSPDKAGHG